MVLWVVLSYGIFAAVMVKRDKPRLEQCMSGGWLLAVVATQALVGLGALLAPAWTRRGRGGWRWPCWVCGCGAACCMPC
ncbi:C4-dicarboxylate transporter [Bordetella pertussis]|nr:C4-dicarboxylate transporter [Bordetella pertussis]